MTPAPIGLPPPPGISLIRRYAALRAKRPEQAAGLGVREGGNLFIGNTPGRRLQQGFGFDAMRRTWRVIVIHRVSERHFRSKEIITPASNFTV